MAPDRERELRLQVPSMDLPFYSSTTLSSSTSDLNSAAAFSPRTLYAQSFDRPNSSKSLPSGQFKKNMKQMTGFTTTEDEFDALPIAVRRKVREPSQQYQYQYQSHWNCRHTIYVNFHQFYIFIPPALWKDKGLSSRQWIRSIQFGIPLSNSIQWKSIINKSVMAVARRTNPKLLDAPSWPPTRNQR
jgi:hypothetical protein